MRRRSLLAAVGTATGFTLAGCVLDLDSIGAGTLVIDNEQDRSHTVTVTVTKTGEFDHGIPPETPTPSSTTTVWRRDRTFEVSGGGRVRKSDFVSEPGEFQVDARTETGTTASTSLGLYPAGRDGEKIAESYVHLFIREDGFMYFSTPVDD